MSPPSAEIGEIVLERPLDEFRPRSPNLIGGLVRHAVEQAVGIEPGEALFVAGSIAEGLDNDASDIDAYLVTDRDLGSLHVGPAIIRQCGGRVLDLESLRPTRVDRALDLLDAMEERDARAAHSLGPAEAGLLHAIGVAIPVVGAGTLDRYRARLDLPKLARAMVQRAASEAPALQLDVLGALADGELETAMLHVLRLREFAGQAVLGALGDTNPSEKWRAAKLRSVENQAGVPTEDFTATGMLAGTVHDAASLQHAARRAVGLCNRAIAWAQARAGGGDAPAAVPHIAAPDTGANAAPAPAALALDFMVRWRCGTLIATRILGDCEVALNWHAVRALCALDGTCGVAAAASDLARSSGTDLDAAKRAILDLSDGLGFAGLLEPVRET